MVSPLDFLTVMAVLYLAECVRRVGPDELTLDCRLLSGFRLKLPAPYPNSTRWGWVVLNPLRPDGPTFSLKPAAYLLADTENLPTEETCLKHLDVARFDLDGISEACSTLQWQTSTIRRIDIALLAVYFGVFPVCLYFFGLSAALPPVAAVVILASMVTAVLYRRSVRLYPLSGHPVLGLYGNMAKLVLYPVSAIRCMDLLTRNSLAGFDPIAVTTALCGTREGARLAAREVVVLRYSVTPQELEFNSRAAMAKYRAARLQLLESFITQHGLSVEPFIGPPEHLDETCETYCPVCAVQFRLSEGVCTDCPNIVLQPLRGLQPVESKEEAHA